MSGTERNLTELTRSERNRVEISGINIIERHWSSSKACLCQTQCFGVLAACPPIKDSTKGGFAADRAPPYVEAAKGRLLYGWACRGWACSKHTKTLSAAKASFGVGPEPDPAVLVLDAAVLVLTSHNIHGLSREINRVSMEIHGNSTDNLGYPWIIHG